MAQSSSSRRTRSATGEDLVGHPLPKITGARLPTTRQVLCRFISAREHCKSPDEAFDETLQEVSFFWDKAGIKTLGYRAQKVKLKRLRDEWWLMKKSKKRAASVTREEFTRQLDLLWNIAAPDWKEEILSNRLLPTSDKEEDIAFFYDQCQARICTIRGLDTNYQNKQKRKMRREQANERRSKKQTDEAGGSREGTEVDDKPTDEERGMAWTPGESRCQQQGDIHLVFPRNIFQQEAILDVADRCQITDNQVRISGYFLLVLYYLSAPFYYLTQ